MTTEVLKDHEMTEAQTDGNHIDNTAQNKKKRKTRKKNKKHGQTNKQTTTVSSTPDDVEIEYVSAKMLNESDPHFEEFQRIFGRFTPAEDLINKVCYTLSMTHLPFITGNRRGYRTNSHGSTARGNDFERRD